MDTVARMAAKDRTELFAETANRKGLQASLIEKDFRVCWSLGRLFSLPNQTARLIFKGGTSLSKVFHVIHCFSEDVDLSLNRADLGFVDEKNPEEAASGKRVQMLIAEISETCKRVIREELVPSIEASCASILGTPGESWSIAIDQHDPQTVLFKYPRRGPGESVAERAYVQPAVRFELGARSDHWTAAEHTVQPSHRPTWNFHCRRTKIDYLSDGSPGFDHCVNCCVIPFAILSTTSRVCRRPPSWL